MASGFFGSPIVGIMNKLFVALIDAPVIGPLVRRGIINVMSPDNKTWWRNFLGDSGEITLVKFDGGDRTVHAVAPRDAYGRVSVTVTL